MILSQIKSYLRQRGEASLQEIALHFHSDPEAVRGMLELLLRKGRISCRRISGACGGSCCKCDPATTEIYCWGKEGTRTTGTGCDGAAAERTT